MPKYLFVLLHTLVTIALTTALLSGLRIASISKDALLAFDPLLPSGLVHQLHWFAACLLLLTATVYFIYHVFYARPNLAKVPFRAGYHLWVKRFGYSTLLIAMITGVAKTFDIALLPNALHFYSALGIVIYLVLHSYVYFLQLGKRLLQILWVSQRTPSLLLLLSILTFAVWGLSQFASPRLHHHLIVAAIAIDDPIIIDGKADEKFWQQAPSFTVLTHSGANFELGATEVNIKAVHNHAETYFFFTWHDATQSLNHLPLDKTAQGWKVRENGFYHFDERTYYEDKFAVMLSNTCHLAGDNTAHLGSTPLKDKPANWHKKGYHASLNGQVRDLWHWKALRTNDMFLADDNYIGTPIAPRTAERRYTAGYQTDGKESGAYIMNWQWYKPSVIVPLRLPHETTTYAEQNVLPWFGSSPYQQNKDTYPIGTSLPSVLYRSNRFEGDRADVRARAEYHDGAWHLEIARKNDTKSSKDVILKSGICLWVAAFDGAQIAHTRHTQGIQLAYLEGKRHD